MKAKKIIKYILILAIVGYGYYNYLAGRIYFKAKEYNQKRHYKTERLAYSVIEKKYKYSVFNFIINVDKY